MADQPDERARPDDPERPPERREQLRLRVRQLILMRETGPKRAAWHAARMRMIWRLHDEIRAEESRPPDGEADGRD